MLVNQAIRTMCVLRRHTIPSLSFRLVISLLSYQHIESTPSGPTLHGMITGPLNISLLACAANAALILGALDRLASTPLRLRRPGVVAVWVSVSA